MWYCLNCRREQSPDKNTTMTTEETEEIIRSAASRALLEEINYYLEASGDWEEELTFEGAFEYVSDIEEPYLRTPINRVHIALGHLVEHPREYFDNIYVSSGTRWCLQLGGRYYRWAILDAD